MLRDDFVKAKREAAERLTAALVLPAFREVLHRKYGVRPERVVFERDEALGRIRDAVLLPRAESAERGEEISGETDGETIWIMRDLDHEDTVDTLIHEAMHDSVFVVRETRGGRKRALTCEDEHDAIARAGIAV